MSEPEKNTQQDSQPQFKGWKERLYDRFPFSLRTLDRIIGVLIALIILFILLGMLKTRMG
ncbi:MAG TPA: hypothetical protein H9896_06715 [Candidatus Pygmaiobacter gallistercoris]|nr:hypothetical protein [Candidatus Pygmaiobacter gallistercoris]